MHYHKCLDIHLRTTLNIPYILRHKPQNKT